MAIQIVGVILGFIAGLVSYPYYDQYVFALVALIGALATWVVGYLLVVAILKRLLKEINQS